MATKDQGIPEDLLNQAKCAVIVPGLKKGGFILSAKYGKGFITCRKQTTAWSAPASIRVEGGGVGFQIGASETDLILLVMDDRGAQRLLSSQFTVGAEGEVAAGPVGRNASAQTDGKFTAQILSWSRSRGAFAGLALQGATLREDKEDNEALYGKPLSSAEVVNSNMAPPASAQHLIQALGKRSPVEKK
jgi:lipid-binding SYLF domain-containing protein